LYLSNGAFDGETKIDYILTLWHPKSHIDNGHLMAFHM